jgi:hypothetical protein
MHVWIVRWYLERVSCPNINLWWLTFVFKSIPIGIKQANFARMKWWKLKGETFKVFKERVIVEGVWTEEEDANNMWVKMATCIRKMTSEVFGVTKGSRCEPKYTWWWTKDVQKAIKDKKEYYMSLFHDRSVVNIERHKVAKKTAKRAV